MASVVDTRRSTPSPSAGPAKSRSNTPSASKSNPVALEVPVIATGARPGGSGGQRELFTEETSTVLVFENGAVIRLSAAVAAGQLLFLTHKESRREVVAQVTRKRDFRPTNCYVEVEFSEPAPGFWGVEFSENREPLPATAQQKEAAELVHGSRIVSGRQNAPTPAPSAEEVEKLKEEGAALREQLRSMQTQTVAENPSKLPAPSVTATPPPVPAVAAAASRQDSRKSPAARAQAPAESSFLASRVAPPPTVEREAATSLEEKPFPKPEIRVNRQKPTVKRSPKPKPTPSGNSRPGALGAGVLSLVLLVGALGAAWYLNWIPWLKPPRKSATHATSSAPVPAATSTAQKTAMPAMDSSKSTQARGAAVLQRAVAPGNAVPPPAAASKPSDSSALEPWHSSDPDVHVAEVAPRSMVTPAAVKRVVPRSSDKTASASLQPPFSVSPQPPSSGGYMVPPKLIQSVRAIASPSALEYFDKSNTVTVTLDALVDASGAVKSMKVLAGPVSLHGAAMKALKQYRYAPARQSGKRVAAHVTVAIKFLFEP